MLVAWESNQGRPKALGPCTRVGDPEEDPGPWLQLSSSPAIAATWGMNQQMEDLPLCLSSSLYT